MKKLITIILILALALPAAALADDMYIALHYTLHVNGHAGDVMSGKGEAMFDFDSYTADLYITSDLENGYFLETTYVSGIFLSSGLKKVRLAALNGQSFIVDDVGNHIDFSLDPETKEMWLSTSRGMFRMHLVEQFHPFEDWH